MNNETLNSLKTYENIVLENFGKSVNENLIYSLFNLMDQDNKYLVINSQIPINEIDFRLDDLKSRLKNKIMRVEKSVKFWDNLLKDENSKELFLK